MDWIRENWIFIAIFIFFIWMHRSGHGCGGHGGHGGHGNDKEHDMHSADNRFEKKDR